MRLLILALGLIAGPAWADVTTTWRGTSLCQVHPSPCHDETVVYYGTETGPDSYKLRMNKIEGGKDVDMGVAYGTHWNGTITVYTKDRQGRESAWRFTITGRHMSGTLTTPDGVIYRRIEADEVE